METVARMSYNLDHYGRSHRNGETKADDDEPEPHLHKNNDNNGSESRSLCHEKMPLLTLDEKTCHFNESAKADNHQISIEQQRPSVHKISHLSKTFTEPINLSYFSQCIKNVDVKGNNDAKKSLIDSKNSSKITLIDEREDNRRESRKGDDDVDYNMSYSKDEQCAKNSKMMKSWRVLERGLQSLQNEILQRRQILKNESTNKSRRTLLSLPQML
uniref:Uncharacterized protein n=1 Tax=Romanomermis culicivorax TaxID=13658 RepID=A0A915I373_ROMCU